jgi:SAM-dependent methyltransferase
VERFIKRTLKIINKNPFFTISIKNRKIGVDRKGQNLNIGSGSYKIKGFTDLDLTSDHYHGKSKKDYIEYDIRKDSIPFHDNTVDNIYCSHVIEHIETVHVTRLFKEAMRVLKVGGVFRVACPDAKFLWTVSLFENDYWRWRDRWFQGEYSCKSDKETVTQLDYLIREIATPKCRFYKNQKYQLKNVDSVFHDYQKTMIEMSKGIEFDPIQPGDHINYWDFERIRDLALASGFSWIINSKPGASVSIDLQGSDMDKTCPQMSLYVDCVK